MPVVAGEKPENERFPGAVATYSIEAMMQDGKALQAGTSHYLGTGFASAADIKYQNKDGGHTLCHTTSWGVSTRLIGGVIMTHGDDDGLRLPPAIAPWQVVIVPMFKDDEGDVALLEYARAVVADLSAHTALLEPIRVKVDVGAAKASTKRWGWVKKGAPLIIEIGGRDMAGGNVSVVRRDRLYTAEGKLASAVMPRGAFAAQAAGMLEEIQRALYTEARERRDAAIHPMTDWAAVEAYFKGAEDAIKGWALVSWSKPSGAALEQVEARLKALKLTIRNTPINGASSEGVCIFTSEAAVERILVGRSY